MRLTYDELVKSLRICAVDGSCRTCPRFTQCTDEEEGPILAGVFNDAADAIEELSKRLDRAVELYNRGVERSAMYEALVGIAQEPPKEEA